MANELIDLFRSLTAISNEEANLLAQGRRHDIAELVQAKARLIGAVDAETARLDRMSPGWAEKLDSETRDTLRQVVSELRDIATSGAAALQRQIDISDEIMAEIAKDARRRHGKGGGYSADGAMTGAGPVPITLNTNI